MNKILEEKILIQFHMKSTQQHHIDILNHKNTQRSVHKTKLRYHTKLKWLSENMCLNGMKVK